MSLETGMLLLHKHGHDCMLVSLGFPHLVGPYAESRSSNIYGVHATARRKGSQGRGEVGDSDRPVHQEVTSASKGKKQDMGRRWKHNHLSASVNSSIWQLARCDACNPGRLRT